MTVGPVEVSVIVPVHDRAKLLVGALDSVRAQQTTASWELIVVDDRSVDQSAEVAERSGARGIRLETNVGPGSARDAGIDVARGSWIAFLDSDDRWTPDHLATLLAARRPGDVLVASSAVTRRRSGRPVVVGSPWIRPRPLSHSAAILAPESVVPTSGCMVATEAIRAAGGFGPGRHSEDLAAWAAILERGEGRVVPRITVAYGVHAGQVTRTTAMATGTEATIGRLTAAGLLDTRTVTGLEVVGAWDRRASTASGLRLLTRRRSAPTLLRLLAGRWARRKRWLLQRRAALRALALLPAPD